MAWILAECNMNIVVFQMGDSCQWRRQKQQVKWMRVNWHGRNGWNKKKYSIHTRIRNKRKMTKEKIDIHLIPDKLCTRNTIMSCLRGWIWKNKKTHETNGKAEWNQKWEKVLWNRRYNRSEWNEEEPKEEEKVKRDTKTHYIECFIFFKVVISIFHSCLCFFFFLIVILMGDTWDSIS